MTARAIYASEIPIISAVGHEIDFTISDFVADLRAPTPSAAAELAVPSTNELLRHIENMKIRMAGAEAKLISDAAGRLEYAERLLSPTRFTDRLDALSLKLDSVSQRMIRAEEKEMEDRTRLLAVSSAKLNSLSPLAVLARGYAALTDSEGNSVTRADELKKNDEIGIRLSDGEKKAKIL